MSAVLDLVKTKILDKLRFPDYIHGFVKNHSIIDNVKPHQNARTLVTIDIKDFFYSTTFKMVRTAFKSLGYSGLTSSVLALITTKQNYSKVQIGDITYWKCSEYRYLPQGACTSPGVANLVATRFDRQLFNRAEKLGFRYTRYADDLTFSTREEGANHTALLYMARKTLELHHYQANPNKVKILFKHHQQQVTGININAGKPTVPRKWRRKLRAAVHQFRFIKDQEYKQQEFLRIKGSLQFLRLTHPKLAKQYEIEINRYNQLS